MLIWGINALSHDASISVIENNEILFAAHAERYSKVKFDSFLNNEIIKEALQYGKPDTIAWANKTWSRNLRFAYTGEWKYCSKYFQRPSKYLKKFDINSDIVEIDHHKCHAASGFYTSKYKHSAILVCDAIGEWKTTSLWKGSNQFVDCLLYQTYPHSIGLLYSAFTKRLGFLPNSDEYIVMGLAAYGEPKYYNEILHTFVESIGGRDLIKLKKNVHRGIGDWGKNYSKEDIAASIQKVTEHLIEELAKYVAKFTHLDTIVFSGGVALNCVANPILKKYFKNVWIMSNPGDAGNSLGAAAVINQSHINWKGPYLGTDILESYQIDDILSDILNKKVIGVAKRRAEFRS